MSIRNVFETVGHGTLPASLTLEKLNDQPRVWMVEDFITDEEAAHFVAVASTRMKPAVTINPETGLRGESEHRTSSSAFLELGCDEVVSRVEARIGDLLLLPPEHGDKFNVLHYAPGQLYNPHHDYFDPAMTGLEEVLARRGQRFLTMLLYLTDVDLGGETWFPEASFSFAPRKRAALIFYNVLPDGQIDPSSIHGSHAVVEGEKWVATKWMREKAI